MPKEDLELEKAQIMFKLARKTNWGHRYDRLEHFKRFQNLNTIVEELSKIGWILIYNKHNFTEISLNTQNKREILMFIEGKMPHVKGMIN